MSEFEDITYFYKSGMSCSLKMISYKYQNYVKKASRIDFKIVIVVISISDAS